MYLFYLKRFQFYRTYENARKQPSREKKPGPPAGFHRLLLDEKNKKNLKEKHTTFMTGFNPLQTVYLMFLSDNFQSSQMARTGSRQAKRARELKPRGGRVKFFVSGTCLYHIKNF